MIRVSLSLSPRLLVIAVTLHPAFSHPSPPSLPDRAKRAPLSGILIRIVAPNSFLLDGFSFFFFLSLEENSIRVIRERRKYISLQDDVSSPRSSQLFSACSWRVLKGNRLRYSSGHCGIERGLENNERRGCQRSTDIFFRPIDSQSASIPPFPASIFARSVELALIFTSCDCKNGEPFGERCMLKICRVAITG